MTRYIPRAANVGCSRCLRALRGADWALVRLERKMMKTARPILFAIASIALSQNALADTYKVATLGDGAYAPCINSGPGSFECVSLRDAITDANATGTDDRIMLESGVHQLMQVGYDDTNAAGDLDIGPAGGALTIQGSGPGTVIDASTLFNSPDRVIHVLPGAKVELLDFGVTNGQIWPAIYVPTVGGGILNEGSATIVRVEIYGNYVAGVNKQDGGGGIANAGSMALIRSVVYRNAVHGGSGGGVLTLPGADMVLDTTLLVDNVAEMGWGGGLSALGKTHVWNGSIDHNSAHWGGGGVYADNAGSDLNIDYSSITNNATTGWAIDGGGGLLADLPTTTVQLTNSTISSNTATSFGGGLRALNNAAVKLTHVSHINNVDPAGNGVDCWGQCVFSESIVDDQCASAVTAVGRNLDSGTTCGFSITAAPSLGVLASVGATDGHLPGPASPALGASSACPALDQSFAPRSIPCALGALE